MGGAGSGSEHPQRVGKCRASRGTPAARRHAARVGAQHALRHPGIPIPPQPRGVPIPRLPLGSAEPRGGCRNPDPRRPGALSALPGSCRPSGRRIPAAGREGRGRQPPAHRRALPRFRPSPGGRAAARGRGGALPGRAQRSGLDVRPAPPPHRPRPRQRRRRSRGSVLLGEGAASPPVSARGAGGLRAEGLRGALRDRRESGVEIPAAFRSAAAAARGQRGGRGAEPSPGSPPGFPLRQLRKGIRWRGAGGERRLPRPGWRGASTPISGSALPAARSPPAPHASHPHPGPTLSPRRPRCPRVLPATPSSDPGSGRPGCEGSAAANVTFSLLPARGRGSHSRNPGGLRMGARPAA